LMTKQKLSAYRLDEHNIVIEYREVSVQIKPNMHLKRFHNKCTPHIWWTAPGINAEMKDAHNFVYCMEMALELCKYIRTHGWRTGWDVVYAIDSPYASIEDCINDLCPCGNCFTD